MKAFKVKKVTQINMLFILKKNVIQIINTDIFINITTYSNLHNKFILVS